MLDDSYFEAMLHEYTQVLVESLLREPNMELLGSTHPIKVQYSLADDGIVVENLVELSKLKEENLFIIILFDFPILFHGWSKLCPALARYPERCIIVS